MEQPIIVQMSPCLNIVLVSFSRIQFFQMSIIVFCLDDRNDINISPKENNSPPINPMIKSSYFSNENQFYLQSNVTIPKDQSMENPIVNHRSNQAYSTKSSRLLSLILSMAFLSVFCE